MCVKQRDLLCQTLSMEGEEDVDQWSYSPVGVDVLAIQILPESSGHLSLKGAEACRRGCLPQSDHCLL